MCTPYLTASEMAPPLGRATISMSTISTLSEASDKWLIAATSAKQRLDIYVRQEDRADSKLVVGLKAFLDHLPEGGRETMARNILESKDDQELYRVFHNLLAGLLATMKTASPSSAIDSPIEKGKSDVEHVVSTLSEPDKFQDDVFLRDGHCCVLTQVMNYWHWVDVGEPEYISHADLEAAHIIPFAMDSNNTILLEHDRANTWEVLYRYFPGVQNTGTSADTINDPSNGIALADFIHKQFRNFRCTFRKTEIPNQYGLKTYKRFPPALKPLLSSSPVQFERAENGADVPFPHPDLLDCHYKIAEILNASGMGEEIDRKQDEWDRMKRNMPDGCLNEDGSSNVADILRTGLWQKLTGE
ncbi:hypothetical protein ANI_1_1262034 [Paecilomyces variotii No. 5]|uniref:HNH nuclease domain-containing protein n=1 Tax=Byssochlamys spectabilis (strain No. 5 / NBRC 109023) TaxID=1356009 RepID=V5HUA8_BYSSN|nr:hypothetical protein ANI_1_1262034 [Paecilomyces variotii No. 5]